MKRVAFILVTLLLVVIMAACVRSKSTEEQLPPPESGSGGEETSAAEGDVMQQLELFVTQTAVAEEGGSKSVEGETTPGEETTPEETPLDETTPGETLPEETEPGETSPDEVTPGEGEPVATEEVVVEPQPTVTPQPPSQPAVEVPPPTPGIPKTHTIEKGESVYCISRRYDLNPTEVLSLNNLANGTLLSPGQVLRIPQTGNPFPGNRALHSHPDTYTVGRGESIYDVACYYGDVDPLVIASVNNISTPYGLESGLQLQIP